MLSGENCKNFTTQKFCIIIVPYFMTFNTRISFFITKKTSRYTVYTYKIYSRTGKYVGMFQIIQYVPCQSLISRWDLGKISRSKQFLSISSCSPLMFSDDVMVKFEGDTIEIIEAKQAPKMQTLQKLFSSIDPTDSPTSKYPSLNLYVSLCKRRNLNFSWSFSDFTVTQCGKRRVIGFLKLLILVVIPNTALTIGCSCVLVGK